MAGIDGNDLRRISKLLDDSDTEYLFDDDVSIEELIEIEPKGGDLSRTGLVVKDGDDVRWLESGNDEEGWIHIASRHIIGTDLDDEGGTSFWPLGQTVKGRELPDTLSEEDVRELIYRAIKNGERTPQGQKSKYYFEPTDEDYPNSGIDAMRVYVYPDGRIETSFPLSGDAHTKWANGQWVS